MASASTTQVLAATRHWLKPVIYILIRCGVTWRDFSEAAKTTFVEVATKQFGKRGRPTNVSRTAVRSRGSRTHARRHARPAAEAITNRAARRVFTPPRAHTAREAGRSC